MDGHRRDGVTNGSSQQSLSLLLMIQHVKADTTPQNPSQPHPYFMLSDGVVMMAEPDHGENVSVVLLWRLYRGRLLTMASPLTDLD